MAADVLTRESSDVEGALAVGLIGIDASRRVGWAKAFDALRRVEGLEDDLRQVRDELTWLRRSYSRLIGFVNGIPVPKSPIFQQEVKGHFEAERLFRHQDAYDKGVKVAQDVQVELGKLTEERLEKRREKRRDEKRAARRQNAGSGKKASDELYANLRRSARSLGHSIRKTARTGEFLFRCSCGEEKVVKAVELKSGFNWKDAHLVQVVHGVDLKTFRTMRKAGEV